MQENTNTEKLENSKVVLVRNVIKSNELPKTLQEFFSFCGTIQSIFVTDDQNDPHLATALITFESASNAKTAVLLNNTQINDRFITVEPYVGTGNETASNVQINNDNLEVPVGPVDSIIGIGVGIGNSAVDAVKALDENLHMSETITNVVQQIDTNMTNINEEYKITQTLNDVGESIKDKALEIDNTLQISNNATYVGETIKGTFVQLEQEHQISQRVTETTEAIVTGVSTGVQSGVAAVSEFLHTNETAKTGMEFVNDIGETLGSTINSWWNTISAPQTGQQSSVSHL